MALIIPTVLFGFLYLGRSPHVQNKKLLFLEVTVELILLWNVIKPPGIIKTVFFFFFFFFFLFFFFIFSDNYNVFQGGVVISKYNTYKTGYQIQASFIIGLNKKDIALLKIIQSFFGTGKIYTQKDNIFYKITTAGGRAIIITNFEKYPLQTQKYADFLLFKSIIEIMNRKEHLTNEGFQIILNLKASLNRGLSHNLNKTFPNTIPVQRPLILNQEIKYSNWLAGFVSGVGFFECSISKIISGYGVKLKFTIGQHSKGSFLINKLVNYLGSARV
jgi:hypothetical protein